MEIIRVRKDIKQGEEITSDHISKIKVGAYNLPPDIIKNGQEVLSKYAKTDMYKGDFFFKEKITNLERMQDYYLHSSYNDNISMSVTIKSFASGLSGKLQEGDIVTIIGREQDAKPRILEELMFVKVLSTTSSTGMDKEETEDMPNTITFSVNDLQAEKLAELEMNGEMHLALVYRGDEEIANSYLDVQYEYFLFMQENGMMEGIYELEDDMFFMEDDNYEYMEDIEDIEIQE